MSPARDEIHPGLVALMALLCKDKREQARKIMAALSNSATSGKHPIRILIVDDRLDVLHDLKLLLELSSGIEIVGEAGNGREAVDLAAALQPDVVLMDLEMPVMDGYQATHQIKLQNRSTRVIILSVHANANERELARVSGADAFVVKGCSYQVLSNAILGTENKESSPGIPG
jgi:DNA-binding NarL/FixJ family response regulator